MNNKIDQLESYTLEIANKRLEFALNNAKKILQKTKSGKFWGLFGYNVHELIDVMQLISNTQIQIVNEIIANTEKESVSDDQIKITP